MHFAVLVIHDKNQNINDLLAPYDERIIVDKYIYMTRQQIIDHVRNVWIGYKGKTDEECYNDFVISMDDEEEFDKDGNLLSTYNPKSKWDSYTIGGRWGNGIMTKTGEKTNETTIGNIDSDNLLRLPL